MIKIENTEVVGWEHAIRGMRNPKNSWDRMDSLFGSCESHLDCEGCPASEDQRLCNDIGAGVGMAIGPNDHKLMMQLASGGPVHAKYRRMIAVYVDITAPLYWWKEFDTYKVGTVANSCSTMHKIHDKEFELSDFSTEHLIRNYIPTLTETISALNSARDLYLNGGMTDNYDGTARIWEPKDKDAWWNMIQLLPSSYNQKRTIMLNYEVLVGMYRDRKNHKLDEWHDFCDWIMELPYSEIITGPKILEKKMNLPEKDKE